MVVVAAWRGHAAMLRVVVSMSMVSLTVMTASAALPVLRDCELTA